MNKVNCVIVTYNRLNLLKECIQAVRSQTISINKIIIVDNASIDGTKDYLISLEPIIFEVVFLDKNVGGSGGFNIGIKKSMEIGGEWVWVMDDDTVPNEDALEKMVNRSDVIDKIGFLSSRVLFTDGSIHKLNNSFPAQYLHDVSYNQYIDKGIILVHYSSFVSCLIKHSAVESVGFPIMDFFIWADDIEYTQRIINAGFFGAIIINSVVIHNTNQNYNSTIIDATNNIFWKFYYKQRNEIYLLRNKYHFIKFIYIYIKTFFKNIYRCLKNRNGRFSLLGLVLKGMIAGLFFYPKIERYIKN